MRFSDFLICGFFATLGAWEYFLSFTRRPVVISWISCPLAWPISWLLNGPLERAPRLVYLILYVIPLIGNVLIYGYFAFVVVRFVRRAFRID